MSYNGYLMKINNISLPIVNGDNVIEERSYTVTKEKRIASRWTDSTGIDHISYYEKDKHIIKFTIKERTESQHNSIKAILAPTSNGNYQIEFYDHNDNSYKYGTFAADDIDVGFSIATNNAIFYEPIDITFTEL